MNLDEYVIKMKREKVVGWQPFAVPQHSSAIKPSATANVVEEMTKEAIKGLRACHRAQEQNLGQWQISALATVLVAS